MNHRSGRGPKTPYNYRYRLRLRGYGPESDLEYRADEVPQCQEMIAAYRIRCGLERASPDDYSSQIPVERGDETTPRETRKRKRTTTMNSEKHSSRKVVVHTDTTSRRQTTKRRLTLKNNSSLPPSRRAPKHSDTISPSRISTRKRTRARKLND